MGGVSKSLVWFIIGAVVVGALVYAYMSGMVQSAFQQGYQMGYSQGLAAAPTPVPPVELQITQTGGTQFNLSSYIASDGSATNTTQELAVTIKNVDNQSAELQVTLKNPKTGEEGLPDALENSYFNVYVGSIEFSYKYLFVDGVYTSGCTLTIEPNSVVTTNIGVELEDAPAGIFADNQTYTMEVYFYQTAANYIDTLTYTILT